MRPLPAPPPTRPIRCYHCRGVMDVPVPAKSAACRHCAKRLVLDDLTVRGANLCPGGGHGPLLTCGRITVDERARVNARTMVAADGIEIRGDVTAKVACWGTVRLAAGAKLQGDLRTGALVVEPGATLNGFLQVGEAAADPEGRASDAETPSPAPALDPAIPPQTLELEIVVLPQASRIGR